MIAASWNATRGISQNAEEALFVLKLRAMKNSGLEEAQHINNRMTGQVAMDWVMS
jgi:hypothetical protein